MITKPQRTRPKLASTRHARRTCAHSMNLPAEPRDLLHYAACHPHLLLSTIPKIGCCAHFQLYETYRPSEFKTHSFVVGAKRLSATDF